ncbi:kinase-like protein, partial [Trametes sanguinea]
VRQRSGYGSFGTVVQARDRLTGEVVAIKVLHKMEGLHQDALHEQRVYETLVAGCSPRISLFAQVLQSGTFKGFPCTVFDFCEATLFELLVSGEGMMPLPPFHLREIALQIIQGVEYLHSLGIIHTDIKPDNIALRRAETVKVQQLDEKGIFREQRLLVSTAICIIDLGGAVTFAQASAAERPISARMYRAPEVICGLRWSYGIDTYAVGCVIAELCLVKNLFPPEMTSTGEHLALVERIVGRFPRDFAKVVEAVKPGSFRIGSSVSVNFPPRGLPSKKEEYSDAMRRLSAARPFSTLIYDVDLVDLLKKLMIPDPAKRCALGAAARHVYFDKLNWRGQ